MEFQLLTLHPDLVRSPLEHSMLGRAARAGHIQVSVTDIRDHAEGKHRQADDTPYGGGAGMVMKVDVVAKAIASVRKPESRVVLMSPAGQPLNQAKVRELAETEHLVLVCGHYEGVDARVSEYVDEAVSIGDYVLTGGELAALVVVDAVARMVPGVLGNNQSALDESFSNLLLEYPQYTRPVEYEGHCVPEVLRSGDHKAIADWRRCQSEELTQKIRPDLWAALADAGDE
ncbi:MAG: tRNA (guanosine(37)-N1)-methyltransferase TrmD [Myxococcota bacterium]|nr:tRNA (guanosine(37)-N1)-methyltransferase TrmD [Myxococcota bacterium]